MVYLLHFDEPYKHAKHYVGFTNDEETLRGRLWHHRHGSGARLMEVVEEAGIAWKVARLWPDGDRNKERRLKTSGSASRYCPICREAIGQRPLASVESIDDPEIIEQILRGDES